MAFRIYTRTGDQGETSLFGGKRLYKDHLRIEAYGTVDELNANLGMLRDQMNNPDIRKEIRGIQDLLFSVGANLAMDPEKPSSSIPSIKEVHVTSLESAMDRMDENLPPLKNFILPGGHVVVSQCHVCRCICRRAERQVVSLAREETVEEPILKFLNRLSDYLFVLARFMAKELDVEEITWTSPA